MSITHRHSLKQKFEQEYKDILKPLASHANSPSETGKIEVACVNYLCIRLTGLLEQYHRLILLDYATGRCPKEIVTFIDKNHQNFKSMKPKACQEFWDNFNIDIAAKLKTMNEFQVEGKWYQAINGVYTVRHQQAHGHHQTMTRTTLLQYKAHIFEYLAFVESKLSF